MDNMILARVGMSVDTPNKEESVQMNDQSVHMTTIKRLGLAGNVSQRKQRGARSIARIFNDCRILQRSRARVGQSESDVGFEKLYMYMCTLLYTDIHSIADDGPG